MRGRGPGGVLAKFAVAILWFAVECAGTIVAQMDSKSASIPRPPLGWSSWNSFSNTVDAQIVRDQARAMISSGLHKAGYEYVNIDEGWWLGSRDAQDNIVVDPNAWPAQAAGELGDMSNIVRFIHGLGLKAGIYTDAGKDGCSMVPDLGPKYFHTGSEGHYQQDFLQFARWGFDYVKVDWCGGDRENLDPAVQYAEIARAIARAEAMTGHRLYFSLCEWGRNSPWTWGPNVGGSPADIWRTSGDIVAPIVAGHEHADRKASFAKVLENFDQGIHQEAEHTGYYNDPDMMVLGMPGLTDEQNRVHMALWAMSGAPLIVGADLTKLSPATQATLTNPNVLGIDQDAAGLQAVKVSEPKPGLQVWSKPLGESGKRAVLLLNRSSSVQSVSVSWAELGLADSALTISDAWDGRRLQARDNAYNANVPAYDGVLLLIAGTEGPATRYQSSTTGDKAAGSRTRSANVESVLKEHPIRFANVHAPGPIARIKIAYNNPSPETRYAELRVNGQLRTRIAFPSTTKNGGYVWVQSTLESGDSGNDLTFLSDSAPGPVIQSISVQ